MAQSNETTIEQMNITLAAFEGRKFYGHTIDKFGGDTHNALPPMKYHTSWDWLMPVWKILTERVAALTEDGDYPADFCTIMDIYGFNCEYVNLTAAHDIVFKGIPWYNQQKQNNDSKQQN